MDFRSINHLITSPIKTKSVNRRDQRYIVIPHAQNSSIPSYITSSNMSKVKSYKTTLLSFLVNAPTLALLKSYIFPYLLPTFTLTKTPTAGYDLSVTLSGCTLNEDALTFLNSKMGGVGQLRKAEVECVEIKLRNKTVEVEVKG